MEWEEISQEEYGKLYCEYKSDLIVFGSETDTTGYYHGGNFYAMTEWGFVEEDHPLLKHIIDGELRKYFKRKSAD